MATYEPSPADYRLRAQALLAEASLLPYTTSRRAVLVAEANVNATLALTAPRLILGYDAAADVSATEATGALMVLTDEPAPKAPRVSRRKKAAPVLVDTLDANGEVAQ